MSCCVLSLPEVPTFLGVLYFVRIERGDATGIKGKPV